MSAVTDLSIDEHSSLPPRCESRLGMKRPPLRRTDRSYRLPTFCEDSDSDDSDDDSDQSFCSSIFMSSNSLSYGSDKSHDFNSDSDEDDELGQIIRYTPVHVEARKPHKLYHHPPPSISPPEPPTRNPEQDFDFDATPAYHGFSYNALALVKKVWNSRRDEWTNGAFQYSPSQEHITAYDGIDMSFEDRSSVHGLFPSPQFASQFSSPSTAEAFGSRVASSDPNVPIFPRIGTLSTIHDPNCATIDRAFCRFPMYTIHKILFLHEMLHAQVHAHPEEPDADAGSSRSSSPAYSDEEKTLVGDDNASSSDDEPCSKTKHDADKAERTVLSVGDWQRNWLARWQVLMEASGQQQVTMQGTFEQDIILTHDHDTIKHDEDYEHSEMLRAEQWTRPRSPKFFFADDDDAFDDGDEELSASLPCLVTAHCGQQDLKHTLVAAIAA